LTVSQGKTVTLNRWGSQIEIAVQCLINCVPKVVIKDNLHSSYHQRCSDIFFLRHSVFVLVDKVVSESGGADSEKNESSTSTSVQSGSVDLAVTHSQGDSSSVGLPSTTAQPLPPPPPPPLPPPPSVFPTDPTSLSYLPPLPPPPVERLPVRLPPRQMYPDVRWRFASTIPYHSAAFPRPFHPPVLIPGIQRPFNFSRQFVPATRQTQTPPPGTVSHRIGMQTDQSLPSSSPVSEKVSGESVATSSSTVIIKDFKVRGATPRFVPRQVNTRSAGKGGNTVPQAPDPVIAELKQNAFVLSSKVQGPSLPSQDERKRKLFQASETGSESLDKTVHAIRQKVSQVRADLTFLFYFVLMGRYLFIVLMSLLGYRKCIQSCSNNCQKSIFRTSLNWSNSSKVGQRSSSNSRYLCVNACWTFIVLSATSVELCITLCCVISITYIDIKWEWCIYVNILGLAVCIGVQARGAGELQPPRLGQNHYFGGKS